ncbi:MAG: TIGR01906 family membrane protein [Tyzzerella sp.]|nr:TIGR01906 family membrane protein [Tyzzerella sp.]
MKILHHVLGIAASLAMIVVLLISSFEIGAYSDFGWYEKEYAKYEVLDDLEMEMSDAMEVTREMMEYLRGDRADLVVHTIVDGEEREFFNDREKAHMVDVLNLFLGGLQLRRISAVVLLTAVAVIILTKGDWKKLIPKTFLIGTGTFIGITAIFGMVAMTDFNKYFTLFHEIFFDNDLWILNPRTDLLIRMLPEGFFLDMVIRIGIIFLLLMAALLILGIIALIKQKNKKIL